jgi:hypothetical protein
MLVGMRLFLPFVTVYPRAGSREAGQDHTLSIEKWMQMESSCGQNSGYAFYKSVSVVFFESNHFSVVFQVFGDAFQQVQFFHCVVEASEFFMEFPCRFVVFVHGFHLLLGRMGGSSSFFGFHAAIFRY